MRGVLKDDATQAFHETTDFGSQELDGDLSAQRDDGAPAAARRCRFDFDLTAPSNGGFVGRGAKMERGSVQCRTRRVPVGLDLISHDIRLSPIDPISTIKSYSISDQAQLDLISGLISDHSDSI